MPRPSRTGPSAGPRHAATSTQIKLAAERAARLTHQLLAFARREVVRPQVLDLDQVISGVKEMLVRTIGEHVELIFFAWR